MEDGDPRPTKRVFYGKETERCRGPDIPTPPSAWQTGALEETDRDNENRGTAEPRLATDSEEQEKPAVSERKSENEPTYAAVISGYGHPARGWRTLQPKPVYIEDWYRHRPLLTEEPGWEPNQTVMKKLPKYAQKAIKRLAQDSSDIWKGVQGNGIVVDYDKLARPDLIEQLVTDVEPLRELKSELVDHPRALQFIMEKELLAADCMYALAQCEGGSGDQLLLLMCDQHLCRPYARLTDEDLEAVRLELKDQYLAWLNQHMKPELPDDARNFVFDRRELYEHEYQLVKTRLQTAMARSFPTVSDEDGEEMTDT